MKALLILLLSMLAGSAFAQHAVEITVRGIETRKGDIWVALYNSDASFMKTHFLSRKVKVTGNEVVVVIENLAAGDYAITTFHDQNENEKLDTNFLGIPKERYGFSNDATGSLGPPSFAKAKVNITTNKKLIINLK